MYCEQVQKFISAYLNNNISQDNAARHVHESVLGLRESGRGQDGSRQVTYSVFEIDTQVMFLIAAKILMFY